MTKKEQAMVQALREKAALGWPRYAKPALMDMRSAGASYTNLVPGWCQWNSNGDFQVEQGCSGGAFHSRTRTDKTDRQGAGAFYPSKLDALKAVRCEMSERFAQALARVDAEIEAVEAADAE